jgi:esterase
MQLAFQRFGTGPPLLILHGLLGSSDNWRTLSRTVFGAHFDVFAVDQRNHGGSPHSDAVGYPAMVEDLVEFMEAHGLAAARLLGHSMGGKTAMQFALTHPERVEALVVVDIAPKAYAPRHTALLDALRGLDLEAYRTRAEIDAALRPEVPDDRVRNFLLKNLQRDGQGRYAWKVNLDALYRHYDRLNAGLAADGTFDGPVLFVRGGASDYVADEDVEAMVRFFPRAEVVTIDGAGHWVHTERPQAFAEVVLGFLGR